MTLSPKLLLAPLAALLLAGCPTTGIVCKAGTNRCGDGCADYQSDPANCGGCGVACSEGQACAAGVCSCRAGATSCGGVCVVTDSDAANCGACGKACAAGQVCEAAQCKASCTAGVTQLCGSACVNLSTDADHCGQCSTACPQGQSCHAGACAWDVVTACFSSGQVVGVQAGSELRSPLQDLGSGPSALALRGDVLLSADGVDNRLYQAGYPSLAELPRSHRTGAVPNQVLVNGENVYVVNAMGNTLQVLQRTPADTENPDAGAVGLALVTMAELSLGANTSPEGIAQVGDALWVPLYGGYGATAAAAGQKVVRVSVVDPAHPVVTDTVDLSGLDLHAFAGATPVARPWAVVAHQGAVYVVLNNLDPASYVPGGPGMLARIDPATKAVTGINLGADCLNPQWAASDGTLLVVTCGGKANYSATFELLGIEKAGAVVLDATDAVVGRWVAQCGPSVAGPDGGIPPCAPVQPGRFALRGGRAYVGDQNGGRLFVLDVGAAGLGERRGYFGDAGLPLDACPKNAVTGFANVSDVLATP